MNKETFNLLNPDSLIDYIPKTQSELQRLLNHNLQHIDNLPKSAQTQTSKVEAQQYRQHVYNSEVKQNLESALGIPLILIGALVHIKLVYSNKQNTLPKNLEESKYTIRGFINQWKL